MEAAKEDLEIKIANEKIVRPRISPEFVTFWLHKFRKLDVRQQPHRKMLIDAFVNAIYLYDDKLVLTFNYKDGTRTIDWDDMKEATQKTDTGSDLDCLGAPFFLWFYDKMLGSGDEPDPFAIEKIDPFLI